MAFIEAYSHAFVGGQKDNLIAVSDAGGHELVAVFNSNGVDAVGTDVHEFAKFRFFHQSVAGGEEDELVLLFEVAHGEHGLYSFTGLQADEVADVLALAGRADVGDFIDLEPVDAALVGEDENVGVGGSDEEVLDEILVTGLHAGAARASAALHAVGGDGRALHVAGVANSDGNLFVGDEIFEDDFGGFVFDARATDVAVELSNFFEFLDDDAAQFFLGGENGFVLRDFFANVGQFLRDFVDRELGQAMQLEFENGIGLLSGEGLVGIELGRAPGGIDVDLLATEVEHQIFAGVGAVGAAANDGDDVVEVIESGEIAFEDVLAILRLG